MNIRVDRELFVVSKESNFVQKAGGSIDPAMARAPCDLTVVALPSTLLLKLD
jgi:hypothetical protein